VSALTEVLDDLEPVERRALRNRLRHTGVGAAEQRKPFS
jgi:hypothetical protein